MRSLSQLLILAIFIGWFGIAHAELIFVNHSQNGLSGLTAGIIPYATGATAITTDSAGPYWDATNNRFGLGASSPSWMFHEIYSGSPTCATVTFQTVCAGAGIISTLAGGASGTNDVASLIVGTDVTGDLSTAGTYFGIKSTYRVPNTNATVFGSNTLINLHVDTQFAGTGNNSIIAGAFVGLNINSTATGLSVWGLQVTPGWAAGGVANFNGVVVTLGDRASGGNTGFEVDYSAGVWTGGSGTSYQFYGQNCSALTKCYGLYLAGNDVGAVINGNVTIGATTDPSVALDVTGAEKVSSTLTVTGNAAIGTTLVAGNTMTVSGTDATVIRVQQNSDNDVLYDALDLIRTRSSSTAPGAGFGLGIYGVLEGFTNNSFVYASAIEWAWENAQTNDTTDRDSYLAFVTMLNNTRAVKWKIDSNGNLISTGATFANLASVANGAMIYCSDCDPALTWATCSSSATKTGALAVRLNSTWVCGG